MGVNMYADYTRNAYCSEQMPEEDATKVFDTAIQMSTVWHMLEWVRWTVFLTSTLSDKNLLIIFKFMQLNIYFGVVACITAIVTRYSSDGQICS